MLLSRVDESLTNLVFACGSDSVRIFEFVRWISTVRMVHRLKGCKIGCHNHSANKLLYQAQKLRIGDYVFAAFLDILKLVF